MQVVKKKWTFGLCHQCLIGILLRATLLREAENNLCLNEILKISFTITVVQYFRGIVHSIFDRDWNISTSHSDWPYKAPVWDRCMFISYYFSRISHGRINYLLRLYNDVVERACCMQKAWCSNLGRSKTMKNRYM